MRVAVQQARTVVRGERKRRNFAFFAFFLYIAWMIVVEWINFIVKLSNAPYYPGVAEGLSLIIVGVGVFFLRKDIKIPKIYVSNWEWIGLLIIVAVGIVMSFYPDHTFDTGNYHIIAQNPQFENYFVEDYGYGNFQVWGFRLADRLFYYFRILLGYRFGTLLNPVVLAIGYFQVFDILKTLSNKIAPAKKKAVNNLYLSAWAMVILLPMDAILMIGIYYVDVVSIPVMLEILRLLLKHKKGDPVSTTGIAYFALLNGTCLALKLTNVVYVVPIICVYLFNNVHGMKPRHWIAAICCGACPFALYLYYNYICTGNPVFPYYNNVFHSPFFDANNFRDERWGGSTVKEKLLWIIYAVINPANKQCELPDLFPGALALGLVGLLGTLVTTRRGDRWARGRNTIVILTITSTLLWSFTTGYSRYFVFGKILWGVLGFLFLEQLGRLAKKTGVGLKALAVIACGICLGLNTASFIHGRNWSWTPLEMNTLAVQANRVLSDRGVRRTGEDKVDVFLLTSYTNQAIAEMLDDSSFAINTMYHTAELEAFQERCSKELSSTDSIYDIYALQDSSLQEYVNYLSQNHMYIDDIEDVDVGPESYGWEYVLTKVIYTDVENRLWTSKDGEAHSIDIGGKEGEATLTVIAGRKYIWASDEKNYISIAVQSDGGEREITSVEIKNNGFKKEAIPLSLLSGDNTIQIRFVNEMGEDVSEDFLNEDYFINWSLT